MSYQKCQIIGRLGADPEMRFAPSGQPVVNFSVATNRNYNKANSEEVKETSWFKVSVWGKLAEACNAYLKKGGQVFVEGRLIADPATGGPRLWTRQNGSPAASFEIHADLVRFLGGKNGDANGQVEQPVGLSAEPEIPF
ncbi:MAG: single-stranded DNA-binding protein [Anaerolineales bacterium]|jgi:single-strand DNA-binding protein